MGHFEDYSSENMNIRHPVQEKDQLILSAMFMNWELHALRSQC